jgi:hypothetical protein
LQGQSRDRSTSQHPGSFDQVVFVVLCGLEEKTVVIRRNMTEVSHPYRRQQRKLAPHVRATRQAFQLARKY